MTQHELNKMLPSDAVTSDETTRLIQQIAFTNPKSAKQTLQRLISAPDQRRSFHAILPHLWAALSEAGGPDRVLSNFERFLQTASDPLPVLGYLAEFPRVIEILVKIFSASQFLTEILLRTPEYLENLVDLKRLAAPKAVSQMIREARGAIMEYGSTLEAVDELRRYQRRELLRIGICDLLDLYDLPTATRQLSNLADSLVQACLEAVSRPGQAPDGFVVIGMGKLGGQELNYSSDIDFLFLASSTSPLSTRTGEKLIDALARVTTEGFLYRVDMRLRPWGKVGPLVSSLDGFIGYLNKHALLWEKQALLKARVVAGDLSVGESFIRRIQPLLFSNEAEAVRADVFAMRQRTEAFIQQKGHTLGDVKLGEGSIRDVEFCVQFLQLTHGEQQPELLNPNTLDSLYILANIGLISSDERRVLTDGYIFLRTIEHHLQMMDYRQTHALPEDPEAIHSLARRLGFKNGLKFLARYQQHARAIRQVYLHHVGRIEMKKIDPLQPAPSQPAAASPLDVNRHRSRMSPSYSETFNEDEIARHATLAAQLNRQHLVAVDGHPQKDGNWRVTIIAFDFPGELSLICGLMFVYGMNIMKGDVFTYEPSSSGAAPDRQSNARANQSERKIVDAFTVSPGKPEEAGEETWLRYQQDLEELLSLVRLGQQREARGELAKRVGASMYEASRAAHTIENSTSGVSDEHRTARGLKDQPDETKMVLQGDPGDLENGPFETMPVTQLFPVEIEFDNDSSDQYTLLHIQSPDTIGFLYEITNALALYRVYIARMTVDTVGSRVRDTLFVTDENGQKITNPEKQNELRAATVLIKHFTHLLPFSPNPESALLHFREFISQLFERPNWPSELASLERPEVLHALARLLGVSNFLWDDFLRMQYANLYPVVRDVSALETVKTKPQLQSELDILLKAAHPAPHPLSDDSSWQEVLNTFKDREMFRTDMRHIMRQTEEFWEFAFELTDLAEVVVNAAFRLCWEDLQAVYGTPRLENGETSQMCVCALGKCGGRELGFASDIELMFIYSGNGQTDRPQKISTAEFYEKLVTAFVRSIRARREGIFDIDLQLRPYGKAGSLSVSMEAFKRYFAPGGPAWAYERQALVKLRSIAGDPDLGEKISDLRDQYVYSGEPFDVTSMRAMRERQVRHLVDGGTFNLKFSPGGLVDVEYLVQGLQINFGKEHPELRQTNTREAMAALNSAGILSDEEYTRLRKAHTFLRWMIDSLRVVRGNARDITVPQIGSEEFAFLTRRMPYGRDPVRLREALMQYTKDVQELNLKLLSQK